MVRQGVLIRAALGAAAGAITALVYLPTIDYPFVLDDRPIILLNPSLAALSDWRGILAYDRWHPLLNVSFAIDQTFWGSSSLGFRITNAVLHLAVVSLIFVFASRSSSDQGQAGIRPGSDQGQTTFDVFSSQQPAALGRMWAAFVWATAFGVNPLTARSVAYVSARADVLFTAGLLLAGMLAWGAARARSARRFAAAAAVAAAAAFTIPVGLDVSHGPLRAYLAAAVVVVAASRWGGPAALFARSRAARIATLAVVVGLAVLTQRTLVRWADPVALWRAEVERTPGAWDAHLGYADALREAARCGGAVTEYQTVLRLSPGQQDARRGLARCH